jgi:hypothetical protein
LIFLSLKNKKDPPDKKQAIRHSPFCYLFPTTSWSIMNIQIERDSSLAFCCERPDCTVKRLHIRKGGVVDVQCELCGLDGSVGYMEQDMRPSVGVNGDGNLSVGALGLI